jgi:hypothetical protein
MFSPQDELQGEEEKKRSKAKIFIKPYAVNNKYQVE